jgi:signal transduction histidine kinase
VPAVPVRDAILNLLLNACATSPDEATLAFRSNCVDGALIADISDQGSGLPSHVREYLEREGAGSAPLDRRSGLGLWIVKRLCDEMHGRLNVLKSGRSGTTIRLTVNLKAEELRHVA